MNKTNVQPGANQQAVPNGATQINPAQNMMDQLLPRTPGAAQNNQQSNQVIQPEPMTASPAMANRPPVANQMPPRPIPVNNNYAATNQMAAAGRPVAIPQTGVMQMAIPQQTYQQGMTSVLDIIAPAALEVKPNYIRLGNMLARTLFVFTYPSYVQTNWLAPIINYDITLDISMFIHPIGSKEMMTQLRKKAGQLQSSLAIEQEKGLVRNPELETAIQNIEELRNTLQRGEMRIFQFGLYFTIYGKNEEELNTITEQLESTLGGMLIYTFTSTVPMAIDELKILRNLDTASLSTTFPFTSTTLSSNEGILYGLNRHNNSLILFDRFNLENANSVVFAKSGSGKSYAIKLEILRYLMLGSDAIVIDPENEYKNLCEAVGGNYLNIALNSDKRINPFDLPKAGKSAASEGNGEDILRSNITMLSGLLSLMMSGVTPEEDAVLEKALYEVYALKDITVDPATHSNQPPLLSDLQQVLQNMTGTESMVKKLSKYTEGTFKGLFDQPTNFDLDNGFIVFSVRDLEDALRPIGMYMILNYIWQRVRFNIRRRMLVIDEAWWMMQYEDSGKFLYALAKRGRKYYLGLTIISQDVEDFLDSKYGRSVINNSSMQLLMKQSPSSVEKIAQVFGLTEGEKFLLLECEVGEGLFFAGLNHVAIKVIASYTEDQMITTDPKQLMEMQTKKNTEEKEEDEANGQTGQLQTPGV
ncbi:MAG: Type IV secretory pathway VirB4 component-like protein [Berkelbacteria bacterium GW2011_GWE1_39_12]|uniref:Type IV secretory pathway VirB4 component-like protein n=1 Tax=Berkelbacteria bacterium GW2011_GWE1_39_12 TaxID=1618337 RepID=A0A0G4B5K8_9BACT|nr:MAG: Type IV secretory pathway VirB4 component-like protein [Berkelbacteria bacterium GW2011_GWE1_39_12]